MQIDEALAKKLIQDQFPKWKSLKIQKIKHSGFDNVCFHLGDDKIIRFPSQAKYAAALLKEAAYLPKLAAHLPLEVPRLLGMGKPHESYPFSWLIYQWIDGESALSASIEDLSGFAKSLAKFLVCLQQIQNEGDPAPSVENFYRGGELKIYDSDVQKALKITHNEIDTQNALQIWNEGLLSKWEKEPVWVHGDITPSNLLILNHKLHAVIDFGQLSVGDPACDLVIAWTFFRGSDRVEFLNDTRLDRGTIQRAKAWALWKSLIVYSGLCDSNEFEKNSCKETLEQILH